jgi:hypothetical protein
MSARGPCRAGGSWGKHLELTLKATGFVFTEVRGLERELKDSVMAFTEVRGLERELKDSVTLNM